MRPPVALRSGPLNSGLWKLGFGGPLVNSWGGLLLTLEMLSICSVLRSQAFFLFWGASNYSWNGPKMGISGGPKLTQQRVCIYIYIFIYIYIYLLWCHYLGQVWPFEVSLSGPSLLFTKHCSSKNTIKKGFQHFLFEKNCARKFEVLLSGPSWSFLRCSQLGPDNNTYLAQIITPQMHFFFNFLLLKMC